MIRNQENKMILYHLSSDDLRKRSFKLWITFICLAFFIFAIGVLNISANTNSESTPISFEIAITALLVGIFGIFTSFYFFIYSKVLDFRIYPNGITIPMAPFKFVFNKKEFFIPFNEIIGLNENQRCLYIVTTSNKHFIITENKKKIPEIKKIILENLNYP